MGNWTLPWKGNGVEGPIGSDAIYLIFWQYFERWQNFLKKWLPWRSRRLGPGKCVTAEANTIIAYFTFRQQSHPHPRTSKVQKTRTLVAGRLFHNFLSTILAF